MTLDEAIEHCCEKAAELKSRGCSECSLDHMQLAEWLSELKAWRTSMENVKKAIAERDKSEYNISGDKRK
jgi:hypothetical protein